MYNAFYTNSHLPAMKSITCNHCDNKELCRILSIDPSKSTAIKNIKSTLINVKKSESLYRINTALTHLYTVRSGSFKLVSASGKVIDFIFQGQLFGIDGLENSVHQVNAVALEDSSLCAFEMDSFLQVTSQIASANKEFVSVLAKRFNQQAEQVSAPVEAKVKFARFILKISNNQKRYGFSPLVFSLSMKRSDIANYLGISIETVSRLLQTMAQDNMLKVSNKQVSIIDLISLRRISGL